MEPSLSGKAYEVIKRDIITCVLEPGQQIAQPQLAEKHRIGLTPVREALRRLAQEGFVQAIPRFGYIVSPVTFADVYEVYELRAIVESAAVRLAAIRAADEQLTKILKSASFTYVYRDRESYSHFLALNKEWHRSVVAIAGNQRMVDLISKTLDELTRVFHLGLDLRDSAEEMRSEHLALAAALRDRDPDRAEKIVQSQIARSQARVLEALTNRLGNAPPSSLQQTMQVRPRDPDSQRKS